MPSQTVGQSRSANVEVVYDYGHVEQLLVNLARSSDKVAPLLPVKPARTQVCLSVYKTCLSVFYRKSGTHALCRGRKSTR